LEQASHLSCTAPLLLLWPPALHLTFCLAKYRLALYDNIPEEVVEQPLLIAAYYCEFWHTAAKVISGAGGLSC